MVVVNILATNMGEIKKIFVSGYDFNEKNKITEKQLAELRTRAEAELKKYKIHWLAQCNNSKNKIEE